MKIDDQQIRSSHSKHDDRVEQPRGLVVSRYCPANAHAPMPLIARAFAESLSLASLADDPRCVLTIGLVKGISCFMS